MATTNTKADKESASIEQKLGISLSFILIFLCLRLITDYKIISYIFNKLPLCLVNSSSIDLGKVYQTFYSFNFSIEYNTIFSIIASLYLPPLLTIYGIVSDSNALYKLYVSRNFSSKIIINFLVLVCISQKSYSFPYLAIVFLYMIWELKELYFLLMDFLFFKKRKNLVAFLSKVIGKSSGDRIQYLDTIQSLEKWNKSLRGLKKFEQDERFEYIWTKSVSKPASVNITQLSEWLDDVKSHIKRKDNQKAQTKASVRKREDELPESNTEVCSLDLDIVRDDDHLGISIFLKFAKNFEFQDTSNSLLNSEFKNCFKPCKLEDGGEEEAFREFIQVLDTNLLSLLEKKEFDKFQSEISLTKDVLDTFKGDETLRRDIITLSYKVLDLVKSTTAFKQHQICKDILYDFWKKLFKSYTLATNAKHLDYVFRLLSQCITEDIFKSNDLKRLEHDLTSIIKYQDTSEEFLIGYIKALAIICNTFKDTELETEQYAFFLKLIRNLQYDINKKYVAENNNEASSAALSYSKQACMVLGAATLSKNKLKQFKLTIKYIETDTFLSIIEKLYLDNDREWDLSWWEERDFDRHGHGSSFSFCATTFHKNFIVAYLKGIHNPKDILVIKPNHKLMHIFNEALKSFNDNEKNSEAYQTIQTVVAECKKIEDEAIITGNLSSTKIHDFIKACYDEYVESIKFSDVLKSTIVNTEDDGGFGYNTTMPKDYFLQEFDILLSGFGSYGKGLAAGENFKIYSDLKSQIPSSTTTISFLFQTIQQHWLKLGDEYVIITNQRDWDEKIFNYDNSCKINPLLRRIFDPDKTEYFSDLTGYRRIKVLRLNWDRKKSSRFYALINLNNNSKILLKVKDGDFEKMGPIVYKFEDLATNQALRNRIISNGEYFKNSDVLEAERDRYLSLLVGVQLYENAELETIPEEEKSKFIIHEISDVGADSEDDDDEEEDT